MKIEYMKPEDLIPYERNAKKHPQEQIDQIKESIRQFGFNDPIAIGADGVVIEGHGRLMAAKELKMKTIPVIRLDKLSEEERRGYMLAHNQLTMNSGWDSELLALELDSIQELDMSMFGFDISDAEKTPEAKDDEYDFDKAVKGKVQRGEIWILGNHRLMCGDSANETDVRNLMGGVKADMVFTDPPYGVAIGDKNRFLDEVAGGKSGHIKENIKGDTLSTDELYEMLLQAFKNLRENCKDNCSYYVSSPQGGEIGLMMMMMMRDAGLEVRHNLIWEKSSATFSMGRLDYDYKHEPIFYTWTKKHNFYGKGNCKNTVWEFPKPRKCDLHPTMKPVELVAECILNSSKEGDIVADIFGGSGTTIIACEQLGRSCRMIELDPHYCDVIIDRWEAMTNQKAVKQE